MDAWTDLEVLAGVPDPSFLVDPELLAEFEVVECVHSLAPAVEVVGVMTEGQRPARDLQQKSLGGLSWKTNLRAIGLFQRGLASSRPD